MNVNQSDAPRRRFEAVIFDCDGVLLDTERCINGAWHELLLAHGLALTYEEVYQHFGGFTIEDNRARSRQLLGPELGEQVFAQAGAVIRERFAAGIPLMPEVDAVLARSALPRALATNTLRPELDLKLERSGLAGRFRFTVAASEVERPKPAPDVYLRAAKLLAVAPERCAVIEDSPTGIRAGVAAGMAVFGYCRDVPADAQRAAGAGFCAPSLLALIERIEGA